MGTLDQQDVKAGCALGNGLHHIIQQRDEGYEAQTETWHPKRSPGEGNGNPHQYSSLENSMDGGSWWATVHGVAESGITK